MKCTGTILQITQPQDHAQAKEEGLHPDPPPKGVDMTVLADVMTDMRETSLETELTVCHPPGADHQEDSLALEAGRGQDQGDPGVQLKKSNQGLA